MTVFVDRAKLNVSSYLWSIVFMFLSCTVHEMLLSMAFWNKTFA